MHNVDKRIHERMLDVRETCAHTRNNDDYVYRAKYTEFICLLEKAVLAPFDKSRKERPKTAFERYGLR